jgi:regulator of protease activity HflC (stomatin/prohibitin superfamily)
MTVSGKVPSWRDERIRVYLIGAVVALGFFVLLFWRTIFVVILPGNVGVLYDLFRGTRIGTYEREGLHVKLPWNQMFIYDTRLQAASLQVHALSREGMVVDIDVVVLFRPNPAEVALLHKEVGPEYAQRTVTPLSIGAVREYVAQHDSHELYTVDALALKHDIMDATRAEMAKHHVIVDNVLLERLTLPKGVLAAVEEKLTQEQIAAAYGFRLEAEKAEAQRLEIKGAALNRYYSLVNNALTPSLLTWRGIEATVELAQSPNSKVVIVGGGKDQLPLILGSDLARASEARPGRSGAAAESKAPEAKAPESAAPRVFAPGSGGQAPGTPGPLTPPSGVPRR